MNRFPRPSRLLLVSVLFASALFASALFASALWLAAAPSWAAEVARVPAPEAPLGQVDNFALLDHQGRHHELRDQRDVALLVLFVQGNGCPISRHAVPALRELRERFAQRDVVFWMLNASPQDGRAAVAKEALEFGIDFPILMDETQLVAESLGVTRTAEALVVDPKGWRLIYRGPIDDRLDYQAQRPARRHHLREALEAGLEGRAVAMPQLESPGCLIHFPHSDPAAKQRISYPEEVAPLLQQRCVSCHQSGGVAPWAMSSYEMVRGWSPMMREMLRTRRMPPWHADPAIAHFRNDFSLSAAERRTLVHWIEGGALRGAGDDPLSAPLPDAPRWALGLPDLVVDIPEQQMPATGVLPYRYEVVSVPIERDTWIRAVDLQPSNRRSMHHGIAWLLYPDDHEAPRTEGPRFTRGLFAGYVPGRRPEAYPDDAGVFLPAGASIRFQLHYNTTGRPEIDHPQIGLYLSDAPLRHELKIGAAARFDFVIPPHAREHEEQAVRVLKRDIVVHRLMPHMHYRGKRMRYEVELPDGRVEPILSVPRYDFNWQHQYVLETPRRLPAGTRLVVTAAFDNSEHNPANPDPTLPVTYGEQSFEEMLFGYFLYHDAEPPVATAGR